MGQVVLSGLLILRAKNQIQHYKSHGETHDIISLRVHKLDSPDHGEASRGKFSTVKAEICFDGMLDADSHGHETGILPELNIYQAYHTCMVSRRRLITVKLWLFMKFYWNGKSSACQHRLPLVTSS